MPYSGDREVQGPQLVHKKCEGFQSHVLYLQFKPPSAIHQCTKCGIRDITVTGCCVSGCRGGGPKCFKPCHCDNCDHTNCQHIITNSCTCAEGGARYEGAIVLLIHILCLIRPSSIKQHTILATNGTQKKWFNVIAYLRTSCHF